MADVPSSASRRLSSGQVVVNYLATVALGSAAWKQVIGWGIGLPGW